MKLVTRLKKHYKNILLIGATLALILVFSFANTQSVKQPSAEIAIHSTSQTGEGKVVAASCGATEAWMASVGWIAPLAGHFIGDSVCGGGCPGGSVETGGTCQCPAGTMSNGAACVCTNGATNPTACNVCPGGQIMANGVCTSNLCAAAPTSPRTYTWLADGWVTGWIWDQTNGERQVIGQHVTNVCAQSQCYNGAIDPQGCNQCPAGYVMINGQCTQGCLNPTVAYAGHSEVVNNVHTYANNGRPTPTYSLASAPAGTYCQWTRTSSNGTNNGTSEEYYTSKTNWSNQAAKTYPYTENIQVRCAATPATIGSCPYVTASAQVAHADWKKPCTSSPNQCGQTTSGTYGVDGITCSGATPANPAPCTISNACGQSQSGYQCPAGCSLNGQVLTANNNSCILSFNQTNTSVNPNGSVTFNWSLANPAPGNGRRCGFYDISQGNKNDLSTAKPIPGLQNLDPATQSVTINNIQRNTEFCLICSFYKLSDGTAAGLPAAIHQWIRVIRIGEN